MKFPFVYIHRGGCGGRAFYYNERPKPGTPFKIFNAEHLDGKKLEFAAKLACDTCGAPIRLISANLENR